MRLGRLVYFCMPPTMAVISALLPRTKPMRYRDLTRLLSRAGFTSWQGNGDHEVWSNGPVSVTITQTRKALAAIERSTQ